MHIRKVSLRKFLALHPAECIATAIGFCAIIIRLVIVFHQAPLTNSDEAIIALMARHIALHGAHPVFFYGQNYMGSTEAYIGAIFFRLFGPSLEMLRLGLLIPYVLFLVVFYHMTSLLYSKSRALLSLALLACGSYTMVRRQLLGIGGYQEILLCAPLLLLLATRLALSSPNKIASHSRKRLLTFAAWGAVAGFGFWSNLLILPFIATSGLLLLIFCYREIRSFASLALVLGLFIGLLPLLAGILGQPPGTSPLIMLSQISGASGSGLREQYDLSTALQNTVQVSIPVATGGDFLCRDSQPTPALLALNNQAQSCLPIQMVWGPAYLLLLFLAGIGVMIGIWKTRNGQTQSFTTIDQHSHRVRYWAQGMLLIAGMLTILMFLVTPSPVLNAYTSSRYLNTLLVMTPALLAPLFFAPPKLPALHQTLVRMLQAGPLTAIALAYLVGTVVFMQALPMIQQEYAQRNEIGKVLVQQHITHIYTEYWTCNRVAFQTDERVTCAVALARGRNLEIDDAANRIKEYREAVVHDPLASYVYPLDSPEAHILLTNTRYSQSHFKVQRLRYAGYLILMPK